MTDPTPPTKSKVVGVLYAIAAGVVVYETIRVSGATPNLTMIGLFIAEAFGAFFLDTYKGTAATMAGAGTAAAFSADITMKTIGLSMISAAGVMSIGAALLLFLF